MATTHDDYPPALNGGEPPRDEHDARIGEIDHEGEGQHGDDGDDGTPPEADKKTPAVDKGAAP